MNLELGGGGELESLGLVKASERDVKGPSTKREGIYPKP